MPAPTCTTHQPPVKGGNVQWQESGEDLEAKSRPMVVILWKLECLLMIIETPVGVIHTVEVSMCRK